MKNFTKNILNKVLVILFLILTISTLSGCQTESKQKNNSKVQETLWFNGQKAFRAELDNGLKLIVLEDHSAPVFTYHTWYSVGSKDEVPNFTGLAHLFEHMMFKATKNYEEGYFDKVLESAGAEGENAFTSRDYTAYVQSLPRFGKQDNLELIAKLEADRMVNLIVNEDSFHKEREVVQNERRFRNENSPDGKLYEKIYEISFTKHPYHWPVIGYEQDLNRMTAQDCLDFYKKFYAPNNATIVIIGDVTFDEAYKTIKKYYSAIPASPIKRNISIKEPPQKNQKIETLKLKVQVEKLVAGYHVPEGTHPDFAKLEALRAILGSGKSSRLYKKLVDSGLATDVVVENSEDKDPGLFLFWITMQKGKSANLALQILKQELKKLSQTPPSKEELQRAISQIRFSVFDDLVSNDAKARFIGFYEVVTGNYENGIKLLDDVKKVTPKDVQEVTKKYFKPNLINAVIGIPEGAKK
jgi:zinc protease